MSNGRRSGALTAGFVLIAIGIIFLLENFYVPFSAWRLLMKYWPLILVFVGVKKLVQYFTWKETPPIPGAESKE